MSDWREFRSGWRVTAAAFVGLAFSIAPLLLYSFGAFMAPLEAEFGWSRGQLSGALMALQLATAASAPLFGVLVDRFGARPVAALSMLLLGAWVCALPWLIGPAPWTLWAAFAAVPFLAGAASPVGHARLVVDAFDGARGAALGVALAGVGLGAAVAPLAAHVLISAGGWRVAYVVAGALTLGAALPLFLLLLRPGTPPPSRPSPASAPVRLRTSAAFVFLCVLFALVGAATVGALAHLIPLLRERGLDAGEAATVASVSGVALIAGRLVIGVALDRTGAALVLAATLTLLAASAAVLSAASAGPWLLIAALMLGLAVGAEVDVLAYLVSRVAPPAEFGRAYGLAFATFVLGTALGPVAVGRIYDAAHGYSPAFAAIAGLAAVAALLSLALPHGRRAAA